MPTVIKGQPTSAEVRAMLAAEGKTVMVAFSGGKDSVATVLALRDAGVQTELAYLYFVPGREPGEPLGFVKDGLDYLEDKLQQRIRRYPHPSLYRMLNAFTFTPPERCAIIEMARFPEVDDLEMWRVIRKDTGAAKDTWVADGVKAVDNPPRCIALTAQGLVKRNTRKVSPIADWLTKEVKGRIEAEGIALPVDYQWFGRSFDGIDHRFLKPVKDNAPEDYAQILEWFPLAELEILRHEFFDGPQVV
ncbi:hypothetical protein Srot_2112 [Segniliparus rotundus DSM 44985]|uniref:Phosphoadenosine phosphosulfate reductase n=1 Tax=Segniliparus rotundus (strain ATCC BAA-972 / CDC 1076 / CIP 108378 / DSM 44985 / JCM 13578) TaxID=640132 RepID=D6Z9D6_SEGRD|nr:hypothetical protein [Segniliparus rotundus]ADG98566.1 hypothetical protein Srot_2112 [Segniliparus rotundus DSM 44985]